MLLYAVAVRRPGRRRMCIALGSRANDELLLRQAAGARGTEERTDLAELPASLIPAICSIRLPP